MMQQRQAHHFVAIRQLDAAHAGGIAALEHAHIGHREADAFAAAGGEQDVVRIGAGLRRR